MPKVVFFWLQMMKMAMMMVMMWTLMMIFIWIMMIIKSDDVFKTHCGNPGLRWMCLGRSLQTMVVAISTGSVPGSSLTLFLYSLLSFSNDDDDDDRRRPIQLLRVDWRLLPEDSPLLHRPPSLNVLTKTKVCHRLHHYQHSNYGVGSNMIIFFILRVSFGRMEHRWTKWTITGKEPPPPTSPTQTS